MKEISWCWCCYCSSVKPMDTVASQVSCINHMQVQVL